MEIHLRPRYARLAVDDGQELTESNFHYTELDWTLPIEQAALICLDCWAWNGSRECFKRIDKITRQHIAPLLTTARKKGLQVIHAPAWPVAQKSDGWTHLLENVEEHRQYPDSPDWPPASFKQKTGEYKQFDRPPKAHQKILDEQLDKRWYHECCTPVDGEAVILNGEELHRLCAKRSILHLFYVGFSTNACMIYRDYGIKDMIERGYHGILLRDCTTGMEIADTLNDMACTRGMIATLEQFKAYSVTSKQLIEAMEDEG